jgi:hypothetical protein
MTFPFTDLAELASCLCRTLDEDGRPKTCFCGVVGGTLVPMDYVGDCESDSGCGMAWVRVVSIGEQQFATEGVAMPSACAHPIEVTIEAGVVRCAPQPDNAGNPPSMAKQLEASEGQMADMASILKAIRCCFFHDGELVLGTWTPIGPEGMILGGAWTLTLTEV